MLGKRLINSNSAASGATCTTDTLQILGDTSGIAYYKMSDATSEILNNVFSTWDSTLSSVPNYSEGNLRMTGGNGNKMGYSNISVSSGKWYWEHEVISIGGESSFGIARPGDLGSHYVVGTSSTSWGLYLNGNLYHNGSISTSGYMSGGFANGDIIGVELDIDNGTLEFYKNGTGYGNAFTGLSGTFLVAAESRSGGGNNDHRTNFGASAFDYTPSTGFLGISSLLSYDGTPTNVNFNVAGKFGNAGSFNGSSSEMVAANSILPSSGGFAISWWQKTTQADNTYGYTIDTGGGSAGNGIYIITHNVSTGLIVGFKNSSTFGSSLIPYTSAERTQWTHFCFSWDGTTSANAFKIYKNNVATSFTSTVTNNGSAYPFRIGRSYNGTDWFGGSIDQVRIFNKALSSTEVTTLNDEVQCVPTIVPTDNFEPVLYTGNGTTQSITSLNFAPDFTWIKERNNAIDHLLFDTIRGAGRYLSSNNTLNQPSPQLATLSSFNNNGFSVGTDGGVNGNNDTYVSWNWKSGGADVLNEEGTIDSQVSASVDSGFSIVSYTGNGSASQTYGHGLSTEPEMIITKKTNASYNWCVYHSGLTSENYFLELNTTNSESNGIGTAFNSGISSSVVGIGNSGLVNTSGHTYISYCLHSVDGMSRVGSYVGGGTTDVPITLGFRPAFVMIKSSTYSPSGWIMYDNKRQTGTGAYENYSVLFANTSQVEATNNVVRGIQFNSNGFIANQNYEHTNDSGDTYIFLAIAEEVFNPNGVTRNATNPFGDASELALYKFEDNANDAEGNYNGTASNVTYATGYIDKAAVFNGSSSYVENSNIPNEICKGYYTVNVWAYIPSSQSYASVVHFQDDNNGHLPMLNIAVNNSNWNLNLRSNSSGIVNSTNISVAFNSWNMITGVLHSGGAKFYINASEVASASFTPVFTTNTSCKFSLGRTNQAWIGSVSAYLNGSIDQVRVFDRALDSGEVTQLYNE